ncbi:MAG TPA: hypothetical protein PKA58_05990 [Polyangium sp.]|nr:hypothetical protein [Polyangium sp.]
MAQERRRKKIASLALEEHAATQARAVKLLEARADLSRANFYSLCVPCGATWIREVTPEQYHAAEACRDDFDQMLKIVFDMNQPTEVNAMEKLCAFVSEHDPHGIVVGFTRPGAKTSLH